MAKEKIWHVYMHTNKINNKKYIGITGQNRYWDRWRSDGSGYKTQVFGRAIEKYGWDNFDHKILKEVETESEACELEQYYIQKYKSNNKDFGYNISMGGEGTLTGLYNLPSMSVPVYQYDLNGNFLAEFPSMMEAERNTGIGNSAICACCKGIHNYTKDFIWSYEKHKNIDKVDPKQIRYDLITKKQEKKVYQYDLSGAFIKEYKSLSEASRITNINFKDISACCLKQRRKQAGGYIWSYDYYEYVEPYKLKVRNNNVYKYDIDGNLLHIYDNVNDAVANNNISKTTLYRACSESNKNNYTIYCNYIWSYSCIDAIHFDKLKEQIELCSTNNKQKTKKPKERKKIISKYSNYKIYQYSKQGNFIREYKNVDEVLEIIKLKNEAKYSIIACCKGNSKTSYGYQWSFSYVDKLNEISKLQTEKAVLKLDRNGVLIKEYFNVFEIYDEYRNMPYERLIKDILDCVHERIKTFDNHIWVFKDDYQNLNVKDRQKAYKVTPVEQYDKNNNYLQSFDSIVEAQKYLGIKESHISDCCAGKRKTDHGYIWKYAS